MKKWCQFAAKVNNESRIRWSARNGQCYSHWGDSNVMLQLIKEFFAYKFMQKLLYFTAPYGSKSITYGNPARQRETLKKEWEVYGGTVNSFMYGVILSGLLSMPTNTQAGQHCSQNWWIFLYVCQVIVSCGTQAIHYHCSEDADGMLFDWDFPLSHLFFLFQPSKWIS